jgi:hypothetical protein
MEKSLITITLIKQTIRIGPKFIKGYPEEYKIEFLGNDINKENRHRHVNIIRTPRSQFKKELKSFLYNHFKNKGFNTEPIKLWK